MTFLNNNIPFSIDNYSLALCDDDYLNSEIILTADDFTGQVTFEEEQN